MPRKKITTSKFSEQTFAFAFSQHLVSEMKGKLIAAPVLPSTRMEGLPGVGFDLRLDLPTVLVFLQFKLFESVASTRVREFRQRLFAAPFFRMRLRSSHQDPRKNGHAQHRSLLDWEKLGHLVGYCGPLLASKPELDDAFKFGRLMEMSWVFPPAHIGDVEDGARAHISLNVPEPAFLLPAATPIGPGFGGPQFLSLIWQRLSSEKNELEVRALDDMELEMVEVVGGNFGIGFFAPSVLMREADIRENIARKSKGYHGRWFPSALTARGVEAVMVYDALSSLASWCRDFFNCHLLLAQRATP